LSIASAQRPSQSKDRAGRTTFQYVREATKMNELAQPQELATRDCTTWFFNPTMSLETGLYDRSTRLKANRMLPSYTLISGMQARRLRKMRKF